MRILRVEEYNYDLMNRIEISMTRANNYRGISRSICPKDKPVEKDFALWIYRVPASRRDNADFPYVGS